MTSYTRSKTSQGSSKITWGWSFQAMGLAFRSCHDDPCSSGLFDLWIQVPFTIMKSVLHKGQLLWPFVRAELEWLLHWEGHSWQCIMVNRYTLHGEKDGRVMYCRQAIFFKFSECFSGWLRVAFICQLFKHYLVAISQEVPPDERDNMGDLSTLRLKHGLLGTTVWWRTALWIK